jgi:uncharacterized cofD-like protein
MNMAHITDKNNAPNLERSTDGEKPVRGRNGSFRVVALGGGTGLPTVLRSLKKRLFSPLSQGFNISDMERLSAIVTVTDDGGSSGKLRRDYDILPPGDIRNCISALSDSDIFSEDIFQYRFEKGDGLAGHSLGNLFLTALADLKGNFIEAIQQCCQIMNIKGHIVPSTSTSVYLKAFFSDGNIIKGETSIVTHRGKIKRVSLIPSYPEPVPAALDAIQKADAIIIGPGSLYTSIIPNLLITEITDMIMASKAKKIYISNLMTEPGETDGFTTLDHIKAIYDHAEYGLFNYVIVNNKKVLPDIQKTYAEQGSYPVHYCVDELRGFDLTTIAADLLSEGNTIRHDEEKLGHLLMELLYI